MFYLAVGERARVGPLLAAAERTDSVLDRHPADGRAWTNGALAFADGRYREAIDLLIHAAEKTYCTNCVSTRTSPVHTTRPDRSVRPPRPTSAMSPRRGSGDTSTTRRSWAGPTKRLAELNEQLGRRAEARVAWEQLLALWDKADAELQPILETAKAKVTALK